jgi:hypothetical protein
MTIGRPPLPLGTSGDVSFALRGRTWRARCLYRDYDGVTREVERRGKTKATAERRLKEALRDRACAAAAAEDFTPDTRFSVVAEAWFASLAGDDLSPTTLEAYRRRLDVQVIPRWGACAAGR